MWLPKWINKKVANRLRKQIKKRDESILVLEKEIAELKELIKKRDVTLNGWRRIAKLRKWTKESEIQTIIELSEHCAKLQKTVNNLIRRNYE